MNRNKINNTGNSFMALKDHKGNFLNHTATRLLNPYNQIPIRQNKYSFIQKTERA